MSRNKHIIGLLMLLAIAVGFGIGAAWMSHRTAVKISHGQTQPVNIKPDGVPSVDAEIVSVIASPDFTRIAIHMKKGDQQSTAIFDPAKKEVIAKWNNYSSICWSPNSQWMAALDDDKGLVLIDRDGNRRALRGKGGYPQVWRSSDPGRLLYVQDNRVCEYDIATNTERVVRVFPWSDAPYMNLFNVKGRACVALSYLQPQSITWDRIEILDVDTGRRVLKIPCYEWNVDSWDVSMSPDGESFFLMGYASANRFSIIGRTEDASTTLKYTHRAVLYEGTVEEAYKVNWSPYYAPGKTAKHPDWFTATALLSWQNGSPVALLDLHAGSRGEWADYLKDASYITWWKTNDFREPSFLVIRRDGLWIDSDFTQFYPRKSRLILRHKSQEAR